jgi:SAM-dependent methyltransferase
MLPRVTDGKGMRWRRDRISAVLYDVGVKHQRVAAALGRLLWGSDVRRLYSEQHLLASLPEGSLVIDVPCGGGIAFRGMEPGRRLAYVAVDLSRALIVRARREAARRGLGSVRFVEADVDALPFRDSHFDLCLAYNSLHCFASPEQAVSEITRVLRPGGMLRGSTVLTGRGRRQDILIRLWTGLGMFGPVGGAGELRSWLSDAGLSRIRVDVTGAIAFFSAQKRGN